jgi:hypothetical protein
MLWRELREVRRQQTFTITTHKLTIHKEAVDLQQDLQVLNLVLAGERGYATVILKSRI